LDVEIIDDGTGKTLSPYGLQKIEEKTVAVAAEKKPKPKKKKETAGPPRWLIQAGIFGGGGLVLALVLFFMFRRSSGGPSQGTGPNVAIGTGDDGKGKVLPPGPSDGDPKDP